jgi:hypothetical protein
MQTEILLTDHSTNTTNTVRWKHYTQPHPRQQDDDFNKNYVKFTKFDKERCTKPIVRNQYKLFYDLICKKTLLPVPKISLYAMYTVNYSKKTCFFYSYFIFYFSHRKVPFRENDPYIVSLLNNENGKSMVISIGCSPPFATMRRDKLF